ncbi:transglutaminase-like domain-containing protein [Paenibacillus segetis]|uniref:Transglutaminase-like domain-containing protein n=1 Tax=Paenibacillus segetis TaxID=1325360 RepID=A0ABQ1YVZ9_9BACL|nr:transglutaminase-like domain-containing protein [Paenibacillus segetis]GGH38718.1 hypothetical protein GCM10008013_46990 [Paenibacillus segetis]
MLVPEKQSSSSHSHVGASPTHKLSIQQNDALKDWVQRIIVSMLLFALFSEWLYPLYSLINEGETFSVTIFFILTGILLFLGCLRLPVFLYTSFPPLLIIGTMFYVYGREKGIGWFASYLKVGAGDVSEIFHSGRIYGISMESRILLLLIGWTLLVVSVQMLAISKGSIMLFFSVTIFYLLALDLAFDLSVYAGLVRAAAWGLLLQAFIFMNPAAKSRKTWIIVGSATVLTCVLGAGLLSLVIPNRPTMNIPWHKAIQAFGDWSGATSPSRQSADYAISGYSRDDTELGSSLTLRHELFFTARSPRPTYWRGESKSFYSGRGWTQDPSIESNAGLKNMESTLEGASTFKSEWIEQVITFNKPISGKVVLIGGGIPVSLTSINSGKDQAGSSLSAPRFDAESDALIIDSVSTAQPLQGYELTVALQQVPSEKLRLTQGSDPEDNVQRYLQLPVKLPQRVRDLGITLVRDTSNRYDAVLAVMNYLESNYTYSLTSNIPSAGDDFVDHFLFEARSGYCDHFSTSMAVLLRSAGIPTRWVKGFAPGEPNKQDSRLYNVSYADAHAWVEVYFPGEGWVPFDPTPGFDYDAGASVSSLHDEDSGKLSSIIPMINNTWGSLKQGISEAALKLQLWMHRYLVETIAVVLGTGFLTMVYREIMFRRNIILLWLQMVKPYRRFPDRTLMLSAAERVWREIYLRYGNKPQTMTVREYAQLITWGNQEKGVRLEHFITVWESLYYGRIRIDRKASRDFLKQCWNMAVQQE